MINSFEHQQGKITIFFSKWQRGNSWNLGCRNPKSSQQWPWEPYADELIGQTMVVILTPVAFTVGTTGAKGLHPNDPTSIFHVLMMDIAPKGLGMLSGEDTERPGARKRHSRLGTEARCLGCPCKPEKDARPPPSANGASSRSCACAGSILNWWGGSFSSGPRRRGVGQR